MFGFSFRSLAEAAISSFAGTNKNDEELEKMMKDVKTQESAFPNILSITKEVEKQLLNLAETNSSILRHMEALECDIHKKDVTVDIWGNASRFYYTIGEVKDKMIPNINEKVLSIRSDIALKSENIKDMEERISLYNKKQQSILEDEECLKQLQFNEQSYANYKDADGEKIAQIQEQIKTMTESITSTKQKQEEEKQALMSSLTELKDSNQAFVETSLALLYQTFSSIYTSLSQSFANEVPASILALKNPLFDNQVDEELKVIISAGSTEEYSVSMNKGGIVKWLFCCHDAAVRFSVIFTDAKTKESVFVEEEHRVKGDGRYDTGDYTCEEPGVLTLIWDNSYSVLTSREVFVRLSVLNGTAPEKAVHPAEEHIELAEPAEPAEPVEPAKTIELAETTQPTQEPEVNEMGEEEFQEIETPEDMLETSEKWDDIELPDDVKSEMNK